MVRSRPDPALWLTTVPRVRVASVDADVLTLDREELEGQYYRHDKRGRTRA